MKVSNVAQLTDNGEIVGQFDPLLLSILREVTATKIKGTWYTIRQELLPKDEPAEVRAQQQAPKLDPRNMEFGPFGGWATRAPLWVEDLRPKLADRKLFGTAMSRIGRPTTFGQFIELLRRHDWFTKPVDARPITPQEHEESQRMIAETEWSLAASNVGWDIATPLWDEWAAKERSEAIKRIDESADRAAAQQKEIEKKLRQAKLGEGGRLMAS